MASPTPLVTLARPRLTRYWVSSTRDYNGRLPDDLCIRVEWLEDGVTRTAVGGFTGESICWVFGSLVPDRVEDEAIDCAVECGEYATTVTGAVFAGCEALGAMVAACESVCLGCGARVETRDHLTAQGECCHCFVAARAS